MSWIDVLERQVQFSLRWFPLFGLVEGPDTQSKGIPMEPRYPYEDPTLATDARVEDLLARMTLEDKVGLMFHTYVGVTDPETTDPYGQPGAAELVRSKRMTHFAAQGSPESGRAMAQWHNAIQRVAQEHPLGIPASISSDPRHSVTNNPLTTNSAGAFSRWPEPVGIAAIASEAVAEEYGDITRREYAAAGIRVALGPQIDLATEPRWARITQTFGEEADLTGRLVRAYLNGFQGKNIGHDSVSAMAKHFPGGGPQKDGLDPHFADGKEQIYPGDAFDYHLQPFKDAIDAGVRQMMPYYGMPVGTKYEEVGFAFNKQIITDLLRQELGFTGIVCTDFTLITGYGEIFPAKAWGVEHLTQEELVVRLLDAGVDQFGGESATEILLSVMSKGLVRESRLDGSARRILTEKFLLGLFDDRRFVDEDAADRIVGAAEFKAAGRRAQQQSVVLLSNNDDGVGHLPLTRGLKVYQEGVDPAAFNGYATLVQSPGEADVAVIRLQAPSYHDPAKGFLGAMHKGSLDFRDDEIERIAAVASATPTVIDVYLERPAVLTRLSGTAALLGSFGTDDTPFVELLFGDAQPEGRLPFDLPRSMETVTASRTDVAFDTESPLFRFGHGLRYAAQIV